LGRERAVKTLLKKTTLKRRDWTSCWGEVGGVLCKKESQTQNAVIYRREREEGKPGTKKVGGRVSHGKRKEGTGKKVGPEGEGVKDVGNLTGAGPSRKKIQKFLPVKRKKEGASLLAII